MTKAGHADSPVNAVRKPEVRVAGRRRGRPPPSGPRARFPSARTAVRSAQGGEGPSVTPGDPADPAQARAPPSAGGRASPPVSFLFRRNAAMSLSPSAEVRSSNTLPR